MRALKFLWRGCRLRARGRAIAIAAVLQPRINVDQITPERPHAAAIEIATPASHITLTTGCEVLCDRAL